MCTRHWILIIGLGSLAIFVIGCVLISKYCQPDKSKGWTTYIIRFPNQREIWEPPVYVVGLKLAVCIFLMIAILFLGTLAAHKEVLSVCHAL